MTSRAIALPLARARHGLREVLLFLAAYLTYFGVRVITAGDAPQAFANARGLIRLERRLGVDWEHAVQVVVIRHAWLEDLANGIYMYGHWPVIIGGGILLFHYSPHDYYLFRNACVITGAVGLMIFALLPVAPPRLTDLPLVDTVTADANGYRQIVPSSLVNQYAAMPSFHAGWNILLGIVVFRATRHWLLRGLAVAGPLSMALAVVATANHFVIDVFVGTIIVVAGLVVVTRLEHRRPIVVGHRGRLGPGLSVRRRASRRQ